MTRLPAEPRHLSTCCHVGTTLAEDPCERVAHAAIVRDPFFRDENGGFSLYVGFNLTGLFARQALEPLQAIRRAALEHLVEAREVRSGPRHNQLSANLVLNTVLGAEFGHSPNALSRQPSFC